MIGLCGSESPHGRIDRCHIGATLSPCQMESVTRCHVDTTCQWYRGKKKKELWKAITFRSRAQF
jgi:hypothetical protein